MINKNRLIRLTQKVIQINSENPPGNEWRLAQFIIKDLKSLGLPVKTYSYAKKRPNIIATLRGAAPRRIASREALLLTPHFDTVPAGSGWTFGPFSGKIRQGRIYGRGATDDKCNLAVSMEVMRSLVEDRVRLKKDVILAATADEETGSHHGIIPLLKKNILKPKAALILDANEFDIVIAQKGLIHLRIKIFGKRAHGAYNWQGINAIEIASCVIGRLIHYPFKYKKHKLLRGPTVNIGTVRGGDKVNMVADLCEFSVDLRYLPGTAPEEVLKIVERIVASEAKKFKIEIDDIQRPYEIDAKHPLVTTFIRSTKKKGFKALLKGSEGATVITFFKKKGIPAVATGFGSHGNAHVTDEFVHINNIYNGAKVLEQFIKDYDAL